MQKIKYYKYALRLDEELKEKIEEIAKINYMSINTYINLICKKIIDENIKV